ncbi:GAF domain-containing protein [Saccharopolyspora sp. NPDC002686]|uniref:helix-turn-helix domain-containing protein n=1 Tax=Saccharopolyspora sp. NPDC002686 TaxID=3154541 RepID=UPI003323B6A2
MKPIPRSTDPLERARLLERVHAALLSGETAPTQARPVVVESWQRSLRARISPDGGEPPVVFADDEIGEARQAHPLARWVPLLRSTLLEAADTTHIMIITDAAGNILWRQGHPQVCRDADRVLLAEGTRWAEQAIGTNAMGTALATGAPVAIHSAEHLVRTYHSWTCAACPVRDPETGELLGAIDVSGPLHTMHPALLALVVTSAQLVESELRARMHARDDAFLARHGHHLDSGAALVSATGRVVASDPAAALVPGQRIALGGAELEPLPGGFLVRPHRRQQRKSQLSLTLLGDGVPTAEVDGVRHELSLRHAEMLALLALHPGGLTAERLALRLHGEHGNATTVRVEIHRLRSILGTSTIRTRPYRIDADVRSDLASLRESLRAGDVHAALDHAGLLLPHSESPAIRAERDELRAALRTAVLNTENLAVLGRFTTTEAGRDDLEVLEKALADLPPSAPQRSAIEARLHHLWTAD